MVLTHDRKIKISVCINRKDMNLKQKEMWVSEFYEKLRDPARGHETQVNIWL